MLGKTALPKLCKMAAVGGGACSPRGAHAALGCPEAWSGCLPPALLRPLPTPLALPPLPPPLLGDMTTGNPKEANSQP